MEELELYVVKSRDGKYFRAKGFSGSGESWVDSITKAKIYPKLGPARTQVTWWADRFPDYGVPSIIVLTVTGTRVLDESDRVKKSIFKKNKAELDRKLHWASQRLNNILSNPKSYSENEKTRAEKEVSTLKSQLTQLTNGK